MDESDWQWLDSLASQELDITSSRKGEHHWLRDENGAAIGHYRLVKRIRGWELCTVVISSEHRGKGLCSKLLANLCEQRLIHCWTRDVKLEGVLLNLGFRRWRGLTLITPSRIVRGLKLLFQPRRLFHQIRHLTAYKCYRRK